MIIAAVNFLRERISLFLFLACLISIILFPIASNTTLPNIVDYLTHMGGIIQANIALSEGQFPLRVAPLGHMGWRYPFFQFYSSSSYTLAGLYYRWFSPTNPFVAYKLMLATAMMGGGIYMYRLSNWLVKNRFAALLASAAYLLAPYNIIIVDRLGAFNEAIAIGILPAVIYYTLQKLEHPSSDKNLLQMALAWYLLATVHLITFIYSSIFIGIWVFIACVRNPIFFKNCIHVGIAYGLSLCLAMWYLAPIVIFQNSLIAHQTFNNIGLFKLYIPSFSSLFFPFASTSAGVVGPNGFIDSMTQIHPNIGWPMILSVGVCVYVIFQNKKNLVSDRYLFSVLTTFFIAFLLLCSPIDVWKKLPQSLMVIQYSWRLLGQVMWLGALLFGFAVSWFFDNKVERKHFMIAISLLVLSTSPWIFHPFDKVDDISVQKLNDLPNFINSELSVDMYLMDIRNKLPHYLVDNIQLASTLPSSDLSNSILKLNFTHTISRELIDSAGSPYILLRGVIPATASSPYPVINALVDDKIISSYEFKPGVFDWKIPLTKTQAALKKTSLALKFKNEDNSIKHVIIPIRKIIIGGFFKSDELVSVGNVVSQCKQAYEKIQCQISAPLTARILELPLLYYPDMLEISVNGKKVGYQGILYQGDLITAIVPIPGKMNLIEFQFKGLLWANFVSGAAWMMCVLCLLFLLLQNLLSYTRKNKVNQF